MQRGWRKRIEQVTGGKYELVKPDPNKEGYYELKNVKFPHMIYTRKDVRNNPPHIVLTNPTMLEYILLRGADSKLIVASKQSLRWVAIDETHSYTGADAAELAMLLRRVLLAFKVGDKMFDSTHHRPHSVMAKTKGRRKVN